MEIIDVKNITPEIDGMFSRIKNKIILDEGLSLANAQKKANDNLFKLLEAELYKYTADLVDGRENETYIVSSSSLDMFAKATLQDLEYYEDLWKKH
jgi:hypothetical protein